MNSITKKTGLVLFLALTLAACKKDTQLLGNKDSLSHSWKLYQQGSDLNDNGTFDVNEKNLVSDSAKITYQFKNDGNGYRVGFNNSYVDTLTWELINGESVLHAIINSKGFINHAYFYYQYSPTTLLLEDTTVKPSYFRYFQRID